MLNHLFVSSTDGGLYDTRRPKWAEGAALRPVFNRAFSRIANVQELKATLRAGEWAWPGGYPMFFITSDGGSLHFDCVRDNLCQVSSAIRDDDRRGGWRVEATEVNWEDPNLYCDHCGEEIESAYLDE